ncbi:hypothetical protein PybrP1_004170, partial [[Pythium] brassicae (nom. inval.)]
MYFFAGFIPEDNAVMIELYAPFGCCGSPGYYELLGDGISFLHPKAGHFTYHWVNDHINCSTTTDSSTADAEASLHRTMTTVLGPTAIHKDKFTGGTHNPR